MAKLAQNLKLEKVSAKRIKSLKGRLSMKPLIGTWCNCNQKTRSIVKVDLTSKRGVLNVRLWGSCSPTPCDWGVVKGIVYGESVVSKSAVAFTATYKFSFKDVIVTGHLDHNTLILETYNRFKDKSGRSDYYTREYLCFCKKVK